MQIEVHDINAKIAGARDANQRVHVGAVHVDKAAFVMHDAADFADVLFENANSVGVGDHQARDIIRHRLRQRFEIDHAAIV